MEINIMKENQGKTDFNYMNSLNINKNRFPISTVHLKCITDGK